MTNLLAPRAVQRFQVFSMAKNPSQPELNEDSFIAQDEFLAVIDGASEKVKSPCDFQGKTGGKFLAEVTKENLDELSVVASSGIFPLWGRDLVDYLTDRCQENFDRMGSWELFRDFPGFRPSASFVVAFILDDMIVITQLGDVSFRLNGRGVYSNTRQVDGYNSEKRCRAIEQAKISRPGISMKELMELGTKAIEQDFVDQVVQLQNNPNHELGHGALDGLEVPERFIRKFRFPMDEVRTLEIFSDGYFGAAEKPTVESWEQHLASVEREDPYKIGKYASTKGSDPENGLLADDRTVLIARFT